MKSTSINSVVWASRLKFSAIVALILFMMVSRDAALGSVNVKEDSLSIPTYLVNPPNAMPRFYEGRTHQGVQRRIYPYPMNDNLTRTKQERSYHIIRLENEFINLGIIPGLGGRIFYAEDKTNGYNWFYRQHVIKPSLIGMVGYWISGSNAWGFPHHHGPNTVKPMDYTIVANPDSSKTIWVANTDQRHRMKILIGYTVFPNSSLVEMTIRPANTTPIVNSFLFWANPSVHVDTTYQVIFPPSVRYVTQHAKREMTSWPISDRRYNGYDYTGVDISLWKNIGVPSSFFSWNPQEDYFGGYDHGKEAGTVWIGNHHISPGMKFWAWGNNPGGDRANAGLTDTDGHYIELMAGAYTDNQPDYSWLQPYEGKDVTMIWFPVRELNGLKYANRNGALNLEITSEGAALVRLNTTSPHEQARVILKANHEIIFEEPINISPATPYSATADLAEGVTEDELELLLISKTGEELLSYKPAEHRPADEEMPEPLQPPASPKEIKTSEELYLTGLRLNQFYNASLDPMPYYMEALARDPGDYRVNTQLGILAIKDYNWEEAELRLRTAVKRITANYTRSRDGEAQYYLGVVLKAQNKLEEAYDYLYDASWSAAWHTPAYFQLAEIDCKKGDFDQAIDHIDRAITTNTNNGPALNLRAVILRKRSQFEDAITQARAVLKNDILNHQARNELILALKESGQEKSAAEELAALSEIMRDDVQSYLELATQYGNAGFYKEAIDALTRLEVKGETFPMLYYYLGYYWFKTGDSDKALSYHRVASQMPHTYCFPFRWESIDVLRHAMTMNSDDARAPYYLGNLLYEHQPEKAIQEWEKSRETDDSFYIVHRNLALAYEEIQHDISKAMKSMENAVACNSDDPRLLFEMDELYEKNKESSQKKYELLKNNSATAKRRTESMLRLATRSVEVGNYDEALDILLNNEFPQFEGGREMQDAYLNAFTLRGLNHLNNAEYNLALKDFETALAYPVGRFGRSRWAQFYYLIGTVHEKLGDTEKAYESYQDCIKVDVNEGGRDQEFLFYRGLALQKTGKEKAANNLFGELLKSAESQTANTFFRQFEGGQSEDSQRAVNLYLAGLAHEGLGNNVKAKKAFSEALLYDPSLVWSKYHLSSLK
jgi:tetratricopeptide (TPR) repeat protein